MARALRLAVWMNGERVGDWTVTSGGTQRLTYDEAWMAAPRGRPLSLSLPFTATGMIEGRAVADWFDNLLPDSDLIRARLARRHGISTPDAPHLLAHYGRDCVGAVQILPSDEVPGELRRTIGTLLPTDAVARLLRSLGAGRVLGTVDRPEDDLRISIAGAQEKTALLFHDGQWWRPEGATPTTHILKLPLGRIMERQADFTQSVDNEWSCLHLFRTLGIPTAQADIVAFGHATTHERVLVVERFDRRWVRGSDKPYLLRLPQEDLCQATGTPGAQKYEKEGGPGLARLADLLASGARPEEDLTTLLCTALGFWLLAAPDGHAKNFSIFLEPEGRYALTPCYDIISMWPAIGHGPGKYHPRKVTMAMSVPGERHRHSDLTNVHASDWRRLATRLPVPDLFDRLVNFVQRTPDAIHTASQTLPAELHRPTWEAIAVGVAKQVERFHRMLALGPST